MAVVTRRVDHLQEPLGGIALGENVQKFAVVRVAIRAGSGADDDPIGFHDLGRGRHPLDGLIQVLVEWVATVGRDHDVERLCECLHRRLLDDGTDGLMDGEQFTRLHMRDAAVAVDGDIDAEIDPRQSRDSADRIVNRITLDHAPTSLRVPDHLGVV